MKNKFIQQMTDTVSTNLPGLLTGIGIAGMVSATILAVTSTPKAMRLIDEAECEKGGLLTKKETYPYSEESRLFYVALTRTKNKVYLFVQ